jgi:hypothetical protein
VAGTQNNSRNNSGIGLDISGKYYVNSQGIMPDSVKDCAGILCDNTRNRWDGGLDYYMKSSTIIRDKRV